MIAAVPDRREAQPPAVPAGALRGQHWQVLAQAVAAAVSGTGWPWVAACASASSRRMVRAQRPHWALQPRQP